MAKRKGKEVREVSSVRLEPLQKSLIVEKYGSLTNFLNHSINEKGLFRCSKCNKVYTKESLKLITHNEDTKILICYSCKETNADSKKADIKD